MNRRDFVEELGRTMAGVALTTSVLGAGSSLAQGSSTGSAPPTTAARRLEIGMLLYPDLTLLDLVGPQTALGAFANIHLLWKDTDLVRSGRTYAIKPTMTLRDCPRDLDILFVPGGSAEGMVGVMRDREVLDFLADGGLRARYVTSVCTGALILGTAGLLKGYRATTHWAAHEYLSLVGAEPVHERVVVDRNRITGGGITAGIDFGLALLSIVRGETVAKATQLTMEYDPHPPFNAGSPTTAGSDVVDLVRNFYAPGNAKVAAAIKEATATWG